MTDADLLRAGPELPGVGRMLAGSRRARADAEVDFSHLFEVLPGAHLLVTADPEHAIVAVSDAYLSATGTERDAILGQGLSDVFPDHPGDPGGDGELQASLARALATGAADRMPPRRRDMCRSDGTHEERWWRSLNTPVPGPDGTATHVLHTVEDVTVSVVGHRDAAVAPHARETRLAQLLATTPAGIVELDRGGRLAYANPAAERVLGMPPGGLAGLRYDDPAWQWASPDGAPMLPERLPGARGLRGEQVLDCEQAVTTLDGRRATLLVDVAPLRGEPDGEHPEGRVEGALAAFQDVTLRQAQAQVLRDSEARLHALLSASSEVLFSMDPDWTEMRRLTGGGFLSDTEAPDRAWIEQYIHPDDQPCVLAAIQEAIGAKRAFELEHRVRRGDGSWGWAHSRAVPLLDSSGGIREWFGAASDVTARKEAEAALRESQARLLQAQKLEAIGRLAAGVAHDFNNVLQGVAGGLELVLEDMAPGTPAREFAEIALGSARRGASLTQYLLSYARKQVMQPRLLHVGPLLSDLKRLLSRTLGPHVAVEVRADPDTAPVLADPGQLETALLNLAINGAHAMVGGGTLWLEARRDNADGGRVVIALTDAGTGMDEATLARACEPFFTTKGVQGSGLGLSMVQGFAEQSGGELRIRSAPGQGTTVELWLPAAQATTSVLGKRQHRPATPVRGSGRVLLVEDAADVLLTARAFLERAGFRVVQASSGSQALALIASGERFDALVTDYAMPGLDGLGLIERARAIRPGLPALLITGYAEVGGQDLLPQAVAVLRKPFQRSELVEAVLHAVGQQPGSNPGSAGPNALGIS